MKLFNLFISFVFLFFIGCSTTYKITDYPSKEKFHEDINSSIENRNFDVVTDESSFTCFEGSKITNDSLYAVTKILKEKETLSSGDIKKIEYFEKAYKKLTVNIWLKNGEELRAENVMNLSGSTLQFTNVKISSDYLPISKVKEMSYKNRLKTTLIGIPMGLVCGGLIGGIMGSQGWIFNIRSGGMPPLQFDATSSIVEGFFYSAIIGTVIGPIIGYITGWNNIFQFKP